MNDNIENLISAFDEWYRANAGRLISENFYQDKINEKFLSTSSRKVFTEFFYEFVGDGGKVQSGGHRTKNQFKESLEGNLKSFRSFTLEPFSKDFDLHGWIKRSEEFKYFGKGIATIFLNRVDKQKFPILNNKTVEGLTKLGFEINASTWQQQYVEVLIAQKQLIKNYPILSNYFKADALNQYIIGEEEGIQLSNQILKILSQGSSVWIEKTYRSRREIGKEFSKVLFSPSKGKDGRDTYRLMRSVKPGDVVIHLIDNSSIVGVSIVNDERDDNYFEGNKISEYFNKTCIRIGLDDYIDLTIPITREEIFAEPYLEELNEILNTNDIIFYNKKLEFNQGAYLTNCPPQLLQILSEIYYLKTKESLPHLKDFVPNRQPKNLKYSSERYIMKSKNMILFGPPGTGKTYETISRAIQIVNPAFIVSGKSREKIKDEYDRLKLLGKIVFTTFHQSLSYEDFIEGIKPVEPDEEDGFLRYEIVPGIFKSLCEGSRDVAVNDTNINWDNSSFFKMSLGGKNRPDIHEWCIENSFVALGWGGDSDLSEYKTLKNLSGFRDKFTKEFPDLVKEKRFNLNAVFSFMRMSVGDIVIISKGNHIIDAIGVVDGDYYWDDSNDFDFHHFRKVRWIANNLNATPDRFLLKQISQMTIYEFYKKDIKYEAFKQLAGPINSNLSSVIIIDEINRGNISQIFGELITLIEDDKRLGAKEELEVILPYSKKKFGVPSNIHILGTMNTADRSIEALDSALRRRFSFVEMMPRYDLTELDISVCGYKLRDLLNTINERIELLLDRDHLIGHSYFLKVVTIDDLIHVFYNKIIPLLQEYFFGDYGKMGLVIGSEFISRINKKNKVFADFDYDHSFDEKWVYNINSLVGESFSKAIEALMNKTSNG